MPNLISELDLSLLEYQAADPINNPTEVEKKVDNVVEKILISWRTDGSPTEMLPRTKENMGKSEKEEKRVQDLFRDKLAGLQNVGIFPCYKEGPMISNSRFGENLESILQEPNKKAIFLKAFNLEDSGKGWRYQLNKARREKDLVLVLGHLSMIAHIEVKGGKSQGNVLEQFKSFHGYMERTHGPSLQNMLYVPVLAKHSSTNTHSQLCEKHMIRIESEHSEFENWWQTFSSEANSETSDEKFNKITKRLIMMNSLILTSLTLTEITQNTPDSHLILLRPQQWNLLWNSPPKYALIHGAKSSGKSVALELGLAFVRPGIKSRFLVSLAAFANTQNDLRENFFENEFENSDDVKFLCSGDENDHPVDILKRLVDDINDADSIIFIDNLDVKDLQSEVFMSLMKEILEKKTDVWMVVDGDQTSCNSIFPDFSIFNFS